MSRKHFEAIAEIVATIDDMDTRKRVVSRLSSVFQQLNPRFDIFKFCEACHISDTRMF